MFRNAVCLVALLASLSLLSTTALAQNAKPKNVLFLVADDLNCDLHCYGAEQVATPNIDALAASGTRFDRAYCQYPLCSPSRSSFLTGRRPNATKVLKNPGAGKFATDYTSASPHFREALPNWVSMPQLFKNNGYQVARVGKLYHYGVPGQIGTPGLDDKASWEYVVNPAGRDKAEENKIFSLTPGSYGASLSWLRAEGTDLEQTDGLSATAAISLLEQYKDKPFFLAVGFFRPHTPYVAPQKYFTTPPSEIKLPSLSADDKSRTPAAAYVSAKPEQEKMTDAQRQEAIQAYHASISFMDAQVGRVVDGLKKLGLAENTVIVFTSDHGYHMYEHGLWQKMSLFENSARVPLIVVDPAAKSKGKVSTSLAELVDLYPTLADLCGLKAPAEVDGLSLQPVLNDPAATVKDAAFTQCRQGYSIRTTQYRFTSWNGGKAGEQLYDLKADPQEAKNLVAEPQHEKLVAELRARLQEYAKNEPAGN
ncbi:sulfatase [Anatilimnocola floriformis]|uniref:sulfatase n=1 Tax=Anatilimnocola floriformis TaxID=2948575 RepID=UPI0020C409DC|nr:sulfatase [Anatilimnocola floriformis]